jgi:DNA-binding transcriptional LysR family regulator
MAREDLGHVRLDDLRTFLVAQRTSSVTGAARELDVATSQVSKAITRLERRLGFKLMSRSTKGVVLTESGSRLVPEIELLLGRFLNLRRPEAERREELTVAAETYLVAICLPPLCRAVPDLRLTGIELPSAVIRVRLAENLFDIALLGNEARRFPTTWERTLVGTVRKGLFATPRQAETLGTKPVNPATLRAFTFVSPVSNAGGAVLPGEDGCPLELFERRMGHQTQSFGVGLEIAVQTDQLIFGPAVAAQRYLENGLLAEVPVEGWDVRQDLFLACNSKRVRPSVRDALVSQLRDLLKGADEAVSRSPSE